LRSAEFIVGVIPSDYLPGLTATEPFDEPLAHGFEFGLWIGAGLKVIDQVVLDLSSIWRP
jgi:hypothetical protein